MDYLDFEITVAKNENGGYTIIATCGDESATDDFTFRLDDALLEKHLSKLQSAVLERSARVRILLSDTERYVQNLGQTLFDTLFTTPIRDLYSVTQHRATTEGKQGVRLKLDIQSPLYAALPWEYLYNSDMREFIGLSLHSPIIRTFPVATAAQIILPRPLRILGMIANPYDQPQLDVQGEKQRLEAAIAPLENQVQLEWVATGTLAALQESLDEGEWHIFHYIGHGGFERIEDGRDQGFLALEDDDGKTKPFYASQLPLLFQRGKGLQLVVLNSCETAWHSRRDLISAPSTALLEKGVPAVLAMQLKIPDADATAFTSHFYSALAKGHPIDYALADARQTLRLDNIDTLAWGVPVLYIGSLKVSFKSESPDLSNSENLTPPEYKKWDKLKQKAQPFIRPIQAIIINALNIYLLDKSAQHIEKEPANSAHYANRGSLYLEAAIENYFSGSFNRAIDDFTNAIKLDRFIPDYYFQRGRAYYYAMKYKDRVGNLNQALSDYTLAIKLNSKNAEYFFERAKACHSVAESKNNIQDYEKAVIDYAQAILLDSEPKSEYYSGIAKSYYELAKVKHSHSDYNKAINNLSSAIEIDPNNAKYYFERGKSYYQVAQYNLSINDFSTSIRDFTKALEIDPDQAEYYFERGKSYYQVANRNHIPESFSNAIEDFSHVIKQDTNNLECYRLRGICYLEASSLNNIEDGFSKAIKDFTYIIAREPNKADNYYLRGLSYYEATRLNSSLGNITNSIEDYSKAIKLDPLNSKFYDARSLSYILGSNRKIPIGDYNKAISDSNTAIHYDSSIARYYQNRAIALKELGKYTEAERDFAKARELGYKHPY